MTNVIANVFFATRSTARAASFGKMKDNGTTAEKRWAREVELTKNEKEPMTLVCCHDRRNMNNAKTVTVFVKRSRSN